MKILILTASPQRDKVVDRNLSDELKKLGHEVFIRPCLREGRDAVLEIQPDIVVVPPIRQPYSRDFVETLKGWGCGVVTRHTEASCDWQDYQKMDNRGKLGIQGVLRYNVDMELVWGSDEAQILQQRRCPFPVIPVGSFVCDEYFNDLSGYPIREAFNTKYGFKKKKTLLIASPWGFLDSAPDLRIDEVKDFNDKDQEGLQKHLEMIKAVNEAVGKKWNILITTHPGVNQEPYKALGLAIDTESTATELLVNTDALIHCGSTMVIEAHLLKMPAFQYGDTNKDFTKNWFADADSPLSKVSPNFKDIDKLIKALHVRKGSNADKTILKVLETGRFGVMDGKASFRAAELINKVKGQFRLCWPKSHKDYDSQLMVKQLETVATKHFCNICKNPFFIMNESYLNKLFDKPKQWPNDRYCPHCGSRMFLQ